MVDFQKSYVGPVIFPWSDGGPHGAPARPPSASPRSSSCPQGRAPAGSACPPPGPGILYLAARYSCICIFVYSGHLVFLGELPGAGGELADVPGHLQGHRGRRRGAQGRAPVQPWTVKDVQGVFFLLVPPKMFK